MAARYEGVWQRRAQNLEETDPDRFTVNTPPDPSHGDKSDAGPPLMMDAPVLPDSGELFTDAIWENLEGLPPSVVIDETPVEGHGTPADSGHGFGGLFRPGASEGELGAARGRDAGAAKRSTTTTPTYRFFNEAFFGYFTKGFEPPPITKFGNNPALIRGINGYAANDGDSGRPWAWTVDSPSWKRGDYEGSNVDRDFSPPDRHHRQVKLVEADIVTITGDQPPPDESDVYASPFSSLQKFLPKRRRVRGMRRDPGPWDEDLVAERSPITISDNADGMVVP